MLYSIHITAINNKRAGTIVAHHIAGNRNVSLHYALSMLENLPLVYMTDLTKDEADTALRQLTKTGVTANIVKGETVNIPLPSEGAPKETQPQPTVVPAMPVSTPPVARITPVSFIYKDVASCNDSAKPDDKKRNILVAMAFVCTCIVSISVVFLVHPAHKKKDVYHPSVVPSSLLSDSLKLDMNASGSNAGDDKSSESQRKAMSSQSGSQARAYYDSAKASTTPDGAIAFYKIAIGFNKYNVGAWYGLVNVYKSAGMTADANKALDEMKKIFGEDILSLSQIVGRFGELMDFYITSDGTYRIEYRSSATDTTAMVREIWQIIKALELQSNSKAYSLYAHNNINGILAYIKADKPLSAFEQFRENATVRHFAP